MSDDRKQSDAILIAIVVVILWISHYPAVLWPELPGNYNLQKLLFFWNKPLWINRPSAILILLCILAIMKGCRAFKISAKNLNKFLQRGKRTYLKIL